MPGSQQTPAVQDGSAAVGNTPNQKKAPPSATEQQPEPTDGMEDGSGDDADTLHDPSSDADEGSPDVGTPPVHQS